MAISSAVEAVSDVVKPYIDRIFRVQLDESGKIAEPKPNQGPVVQESPLEAAHKAQLEREKAAAEKLAAEKAAAQFAAAKEAEAQKAAQDAAQRAAQQAAQAAAQVAAQQAAQAPKKEETKKPYALKGKKKTSDGVDLTYQLHDSVR